jgi:hypothetical protein
MLLLHQIALQEALREQQQMHALHVGLRRELLDTQQRSFDVAQDLRRLAGTNPQRPKHAAIIERLGWSRAHRASR